MMLKHKCFFLFIVIAMVIRGGNILHLNNTSAYQSAYHQCLSLTLKGVISYSSKSMVCELVSASIL